MCRSPQTRPDNQCEGGGSIIPRLLPPHAIISPMTFDLPTYDLWHDRSKVKCGIIVHGGQSLGTRLGVGASQSNHSSHHRWPPLPPLVVDVAEIWEVRPDER